MSVLLSLTSVAAFMMLGGGHATAADLHPLTVTSTTSAACHWGISKTAPSSVTLAIGEGFDIPYTVDVTKTCTNDVQGTVSGAGSPVSVAVTLVDTNGQQTVANVSNCTSDVLHGFTCSYDAHAASTADGNVNATATYGDASTATGTTTYSFSGVVPAENSVDILDSQLSTPLAIHLDHSATFNYTVHVSYSTCGTFTVNNTASVKDDTILATATATVMINVPCSSGCTLTQGYWKTHSVYGPAPSDATWNKVLPSGPDSTFFLSGQTWYQVFNTPPSGGNAYYILAVQYMAAKLNILSGASTTADVNAALTWATTFFSTYTPGDIAALSKDSTLRATAISAAATLDSYNSGATGPGHCDS